jgi:hypothetical protein
MKDLTSKIKEILDTPNDKIDIESAAVVLLKVNRNRILHESIIRRNNTAKLKYELQKIYDFRMNEAAVEETKELEKQAETILTVTFPKIETKEKEETKGKRPDHDQLPDEIKSLYLENQNNYPRMRKLHEQLKLMSETKACDRYPFLKELKELDEQVRTNWDKYDAFVIVPDNSGNDDDNENTKGGAPTGSENTPVITVDGKKISAARKYLSDNKSKLAELQEQEDKSKYLALLPKMQERLELLIAAGAGISPEYLEELKRLGLYA